MRQRNAGDPGRQPGECHDNGKRFDAPAPAQRTNLHRESEPVFVRDAKVASQLLDADARMPRVCRLYQQPVAVLVRLAQVAAEVLDADPGMTSVRRTHVIEWFLVASPVPFNVPPVSSGESPSANG